MVAPTRAPQSRGVKCDLCKKIILKATWLDQTKPARSVEDAEIVLNLIQEHRTDGCPCMPKNIENLLIGSTHFEIHRLVAKQIDLRVHGKQCERFNKNLKQSQREGQNAAPQIINDCKVDQKSSRFKTCVYECDAKYHGRTKQQLDHLVKAIEAWREAVEDQANPFNSKLALRLGLTHHTIYACYLFKYYHLLHHQLLTANLLLNLFRSIEGVTANAILHANFLLIKTLIDCDQLKLARHYMDQATKIFNYQDKTHYESILLTCASCELSLLDGLANEQSYSLTNLADLATICSDDKLQHYYARTYAMTVIIRYMHYYKSRSDLCFEFYHTYRYICAIIRRCYESSFELILSEKEPLRQTNPEAQHTQILDHSWIRFAVCDLVYRTFDLLSNFYSRAGTPESLELLHNGLDLIAYRNGSYFWQGRLASISAGLDSLCSKHEHAEKKRDTILKIVGYDTNLMMLEAHLLTCEQTSISIAETEVILDGIRRCHARHKEKLDSMELYDFISNTWTKLSGCQISDNDLIVLERSFDLRKYSLRSIRVCVRSLMASNKVQEARDIVNRLAIQVAAAERQVFEYYECHLVLETMLYCCDIFNTEMRLLEVASTSNLFLNTAYQTKPKDLESKLASLNISTKQAGPVNQRPTRSRRNAKSKSKFTKNPCFKKASYDLGNGNEILSDTIEALKKFDTLTDQNILVAYLKNSAPNPDYQLYRQAHELMFSLCLKEEQNRNNDQLLYHFLESGTTNTMRYRWMMFEEQQSATFDRPSSDRCDTHIRQLSFEGALTNYEKVSKSLVKHIPEDWLLIQLKYIQNMTTFSEHLLILCLDGGNMNQPIYLHSKRAVSPPGDSFEEAETSEENFESRTLPNRLLSQINESRKVLLSANNRSRGEQRQRIESDISEILRGVESWLGPFKFILCGKSCDSSYNKFVQNLMDEIQLILKSYVCNSEVALRLALQNTGEPLLSRDEFLSAISCIFDCPSKSILVRDCYDKWLRAIESFLSDNHPSLNKSVFLQNLHRGQIGLILDKKLDHIPFESLPVPQILKQGIFRIPSIRILNAIQGNQLKFNQLRANRNEVAYILDPASNLSRTRERFESKLSSIKNWIGTINKPPSTEDLENWLASKDIYIFIGHGAGSVYYNRLNKGRGIHTLPGIKPVSIVMGCSSGRVQAEGPNLEPFGMNWAFVFRGSPCYLGLLWDVTDTDIDRFLDHLLSHWMGSSRWKVEDSGDIAIVDDNKMLAITNACARARHNCQLKFLVGSTPVVFGLPIVCSD